MSECGFIPPGHAAIIPIRVLEAWPHESGAWLSIQAIGPSMALVWRTSDSWAATACLIAEVCETLDREENITEARRLAEFFLDQGPPAALMASAKRSSEIRSAKAARAASARWAKRDPKSGEAPSDSKLPSPQLTQDIERMLEVGPAHDQNRWTWSHEGKSYYLRAKDNPKGCYIRLLRADIDRFAVSQSSSESEIPYEVDRYAGAPTKIALAKAEQMAR